MNYREEVEKFLGYGHCFNAHEVAFYSAIAAHAARAEREECAKICESLFDMDDNSCNEAELCASAIRNKA